MLNNAKEKRCKMDKTNVIYRIKCRQCEGCYIGETCKKVKERMYQHSYNVRTETENSLVYQHCNRTGHSMLIEEPEILSTNKNSRSRRFLEAFHSKIDNNSFNRHLDFSEIYIPIIKSALCND